MKEAANRQTRKSEKTAFLALEREREKGNGLWEVGFEVGEQNRGRGMQTRDPRKSGGMPICKSLEVAFISLKKKGKRGE